MAKAGIPANESFADFFFPVSGLDTSQGFGRQRKGTTPLGVNVRGYEPGSERARGGQRPGSSKYVAQRLPSGAALVQDVGLVVGVGYTPPSGTVQTSNSGRVVTVVAVGQGNVYVADVGDAAWTSPTNTAGTPPLNSTGVIFSAANNQKLYFADGTHSVKYDPSTGAGGTVSTWAATAGTLPVDSAGNKPRLICTWRGRTVVSGLLKDPQNWFMSAVADPTNFDYAPLSPSASQAIAGNNSPLGTVGDVITSLVPFTDDVLIFGGDHSIWLMNGDPMAGGQIDLVTNSIGMAWGQPWCIDPYGTIYFFSNRAGIYTLVPGQKPQRISQSIEQPLQQVDTGANTIRMCWNDRFQGLHVFITPTAAAGATTHFFWEQRTGAWWEDVFATAAHNPLCCAVIDGNRPGDRVPVIGSWDGYVRALDPTATTDDGTAIASSVMLGPVLTQDLDEILAKDVQAVLGANSGDVTWGVHVANTAEEAVSSTAAVTGTWSAGRNYTNHIRRSGHACYLKITAAAAWAFESARLRVSTRGRIRRRSKSL